MGFTRSEDKVNNPTSTAQAITKKDVAAKPDAFIFAFIKAKKDLLLYPASNPVVQESINGALRVLKEGFPTEETVELFVEKDRLLVSGVEINARDDTRIKELCISLYKRGIRRIIFDSNISYDEMRILLGIINLKVEEIGEAGGIEKLTKCRGIVGAVVQESDELTIVEMDNLVISDDIPGLEGLEEIEFSMEELNREQGFNRMFVKGDLASLKRLRVLLENPRLFARFLEKFSLQLEKVEGKVDAAGRVERLLKMLNTVGGAITSLPSQQEQSELLGNLSASVFGLSENLRTELVNQGFMPNLALSSIESRILGRFPISEIADVLLENFEVSGGAASVMRSYLMNIDLSRDDRTSLAESLKSKLSENGMLTPEIESVLTVEEDDVDVEVIPDERAVPAPDMLAPSIDGYPAEKILFLDDERPRLINQVSGEFSAPTEEAMVPALLELLRYDTAPASHTILVERAGSYIGHFLAKNDYEHAAALVQGLQADLVRKQRVFSKAQLATLKKTLDEYVAEQKIKELIETFRRMNRESPEFGRLVKYFEAVGSSAIEALVHSLESEESRHIRLLICQAIAQIGDRCIASVGEKIDHPKWFVVRNAVSILGQTGSPACIRYLRKALSHGDHRVRKETVRALASIRTDEAVELLCNSLDDADAGVCKAALGWIATIGTEQALPALARFLSGKQIWRRSDDLLELAIDALANIGSDSAIGLLKRLSQTRSLFRRRKASHIRESSMAALRKVEGE